MDIIQYLLIIQLIIKRLIGDVNVYYKHLSDFENNNDKLLVAFELFYKSFKNHLSIVNNEFGIGNKLIQPITKENGNTTVIKYNNIIIATIDNISIDKTTIIIGNITYNINLLSVKDTQDILLDIEISLDTIAEYINKYINNIKILI